MLTYGVLMWSLWIKERLELQRQEAAQKSRRQKMEVLLAARQAAPPPETEESKAIKQAPKTRKPPMLKKAGKAPTPAATEHKNAQLRVCQEEKDILSTSVMVRKPAASPWNPWKQAQNSTPEPPKSTLNDGAQMSSQRQPVKLSKGSHLEQTAKATRTAGCNRSSNPYDVQAASAPSGLKKASRDTAKTAVDSAAKESAIVKQMKTRADERAERRKVLEQKYQQKQQEKEKAEELRADEEHRQQREIQQEQARQRRQKKLEAEQQERALEHAKQILAQKVCRMCIL